MSVASSTFIGGPVEEQQRSRGSRTQRAGQLPVRKDIDLLATIEQENATGSFGGKVFGNIIELGGESLILECPRELEAGRRIKLSMVFPGQPRGDDPFAHLYCSVRKACDWPNLHFEVEIVDMNEATRQRLERYLSQPSPAEATLAGRAGS